MWRYTSRYADLYLYLLRMHNRLLHGRRPISYAVDRYLVIEEQQTASPRRRGTCELSEEKYQTTSLSLSVKRFLRPVSLSFSFLLSSVQLMSCPPLEACLSLCSFFFSSPPSAPLFFLFLFHSLRLLTRIYYTRPERFLYVHSAIQIEEKATRAEREASLGGIPVSFLPSAVRV